MTKLEQLELQSLTRFVGANISASAALNKACIIADEYSDDKTADKLLRYAELKEKESRETP